MNGDASSSTSGEASQADGAKNEACEPSSSTTPTAKPIPVPQGSHQGCHHPSRSQPFPRWPANAHPYMYHPMMVPAMGYPPCQPRSQYRYPMPGVSPYLPNEAYSRQMSQQPRMVYLHANDHPAKSCHSPIARKPSLKRQATTPIPPSKSPDIIITSGPSPPTSIQKPDQTPPPKKKRKTEPPRIINPYWDFHRMGIGGLDKEFGNIFRRAFASRIFPLEITEQLGMKHVRGILLYGPPGTGKTLIARQIAAMLNSHEPKIVNGPEIFHKWLGESEANMRKLFADAEREWNRCGSKSGLHVIIFDELDAICRPRGTNPDGNGVGDKIVNQLLSKMDGFEQLNNILVIGMTNRRDMIDTALLRPGRMEVQLEISLPDEKGRTQILKIHTAKMREFKKLDDDVDLGEIAKRTANFSGAEIEGLVRAAQSSAMNRLIKVGRNVSLDEDAVEKLKVTMEDFNYALANDIKPSTVTADSILTTILRGELINWCPEIDEILEIGKSLSKQSKMPPQSRGLIKLLITGAPNTGKTYLAAKIAKDSGFPVVKICQRQSMVGMSDFAKCQFMQSLFDEACKSMSSVLLIDNIEAIIGYTPIGQRFSNQILQELLVLLNTQPPVGHRLLILATSSMPTFMNDVGLASRFSKIITIQQLHSADEFITIAQQSGIFDEAGLTFIREKLKTFEKIPSMGIKSLLELLDFVSMLDNPPQALILELQKLVIS